MNEKVTYVDFTFVYEMVFEIIFDKTFQELQIILIESSWLLLLNIT